MKRTVAFLLALFLVFGTMNAGAEKIWSVSNSDEVSSATGIWMAIPLAEPMRKLGYDVSYKEGIISASKKYETQEVKFVIDVPKAIFYYTVNEEKYDGRLYSRPRIYKGITYVDMSFFENYVAKFENKDFVREWDSFESSFSIYNFDKEKAEFNKSYNEVKDEYEKHGLSLDNKSENESILKMTFDSILSCEKLGISVKSGGYLNADIYQNPEKNIASVSMNGNVSGFLNIIKLASGKPLDESREINISMYIDDQDMYTKNNIAPVEDIGEKWLRRPNMTQFTQSGKYGDLSNVIDIMCENSYIEGEDKERLYNVLTELLPLLQKKVSFSEEGGKVYVKSSYVKEDIREAIRLFINEYSKNDEEAITTLEKIFDDSEITITGLDEYENDKLLSSDADVKIKVQFEIPNANVSVTYDVNMKVEVVGGKSNASKTAPSSADVYVGDSI